MGGSTGLSYYIDSTTNTAVVAQGSCTEANVTVPATYNTTYTVVGVNASGFANDTALKTMTFASSSAITMVGSQAFISTGLTTFTMPTNVSVINPSTFMNCRSLKSFVFDTGSTCTAILDHAFTGCVKLESTPLPVGLVSIGDAAFQGCLSLVRAIFPLSFTTLGEAAYEDCIKLGLIYFQTNISSIGNFAFKNCGKAWAFFSGDLPSGYAAVGQWWNYLYGSYSGTTSAPTKNSAGSSLTTAGDYVPVYTNKSTLNYNDAGFYYTKYLSTDPARDYEVVIILYNGSTSSDGAGTVDLTVPNTFTDDDGTHRVIGIDNSAFESHTELGSVTFAANLQFINEKAFYNDKNIASIGFTGATGLTKIGDYAFSGSDWNGVTSLVILASVTTIGTRAFDSFPNLASLTFTGATDGTSHLTSIGSYAFQYDGTSFTTNNAANGALTLPASLTSVGDHAFQGAKFIYSVTFKSTGSLEIQDSSFRDIYYLTAISLPSTATAVTIGSNAFAIGDFNMTFNGTTLHSVYIPSNVTKLGSKVFNERIRLTIYCEASAKLSGYNSNFSASETITLGDTVKNSWLALYYNVGTGTGKRNLLHYNDSAHGEFDFLETTANATTSILTRYYFNGSSTVSLTPNIPSSVTTNGAANTPTSIGDLSFIWSTVNLNPVDGKVGIWTDNASSCLTSVTAPNSIVTIGNYAFTTCTLLTQFGNGTAYTFPTALKTLGASAFTYSGLLKAYLPGVTSINAENPFLGCFQLSVLQINSDATSSGQTYYSDENNIYKASGNNKYNELVLGADGASTFNGSTTDTIAWGCTIIDSKAYRGQRKVASIQIPYTVTKVGSYFMDSIGSGIDAAGVNGSNALTSVRFYTNDTGNYPISRCTTFEDIAFWGCTKLVTMEFPSSLTTIGVQTFQNCSALTYCPTASTGTGTSGLLDLSGTSISAIGVEAFRSCSSLTKIVLPTALTAISQGTFNGCSSVTSVTLGSATTSIGNNSFINCSSLASITLPSTVTTVSDNAFSGDTSLTSAILSSSLTSLGSNAFNGDKALTTVTFNNDQTTAVTLTGTTFQNCSSLTSIVLPKGVSCTGKAFWGCKGLADASAATGTIKGVFLNMTGTEYSASTVYGSALPQGWNYYKNGTAVTYACHATSAAEATCSMDTGMKYWHYVGGVPTLGYGTDS